MAFKVPENLLDPAKRPEISEIRSMLTEAGDYLRGLTAKRNKGEITDEAAYRADVKSAVDAITDFDPIVSAYERGVIVEQRGRKGPQAATSGEMRDLDNPGLRSFGELTVDHDNWKEARDKNRFGADFTEIEMRGSLFSNNGASFRTLIDSSDNEGGPFRPVGMPFLAPQGVRQRRLFLRDLLTVQETSLATVPYIREKSALAYEGGASAVAEGSAKPEQTMLFVEDEAPARKIAAWVPVTEEILMDAPTVRGYIDNRLAYLLALREEALGLSGTGVLPEIKGILSFTGADGVQTQAFTSSDVAITLGLAIGKVENVDGEADGIVMNPLTYWAMVTTRHNTFFDGAGMNTGGVMPWGGVPGGIWGLPVVRSRALATNKALVGSFRMGATLFDRMMTTIRLGNQHSDYFTNNKVAILAEERVALAVHRPDFFVDTTIA